MNSLSVDVQCYCGRKVRGIAVEPQPQSPALVPTVVYCDPDRDGCGRYFLVGGSIEIRAQVSRIPDEVIDMPNGSTKLIFKPTPDNGNGRPVSEVAP